MTTQLRILRVFRWTALFIAIMAFNAMGLKVYREWSYDSRKIEFREVVWIVELHGVSILLAALVWISSSMADKYLRSSQVDSNVVGPRNE